MNEQYQSLVRELCAYGVSTKLLEKTWKKCPQELNEQQVIQWFKEQLVVRGCCRTVVIFGNKQILFDLKIKEDLTFD